MKRAILAGAYWLGMAVSAQAVVMEGPVGYNGHTYYLVGDPSECTGCYARISWDAAEAEAISLGGHLVTVDDAAENDFLLDTFATVLKDWGELWIGYYRDDGSDPFQWVSGAPVGFENWAAGQPGSHLEAAMIGNGNGQWLALSDPGEPEFRYGLVEVPAPLAAAPEPSTIVYLASGLVTLVAARRRRR